MPRYETEWRPVAGRRVKVATGRDSQTINICTPAGTDGVYEEKVRLRGRFINANDLARLPVESVAELVRHLVVEYGGKPEIGNVNWRSAATSASPPSPMPLPAASAAVETPVANTPDTNSKRSRVEPVFCWLAENGEGEWPTSLLQLTDGLSSVTPLGPFEELFCTTEKTVNPSPQRLAWMIRNAERLIPQNGVEWRTLANRVVNHPDREVALQRLDVGNATGISSAFVLEGATHCDCLIVCRNALVWVEGKRHDWLSPGIKWDTARDQLARNLEAAWIEAGNRRKAYYCVVICHEFDLKYHEQLLIDGYRAGTWTGGWPHLPEAQRADFSRRIGTVRWSAIARNWPDLLQMPALHDLTHPQD